VRKTRIRLILLEPDCPAYDPVNQWDVHARSALSLARDTRLALSKGMLRKSQGPEREEERGQSTILDSFDPSFDSRVALHF
jgi:hypothetical protein